MNYLSSESWVTVGVKNNQHFLVEDIVIRDTDSHEHHPLQCKIAVIVGVAGGTAKKFWCYFFFLGQYSVHHSVNNLYVDTLTHAHIVLFPAFKKLCPL